MPFAGIIALFVAIAGLIPLVGATLGAVVGAGAGFLTSTRAGIVLLVFFIAYQQLENHLLQPVVYARTVKVSPLTAAGELAEGERAGRRDVAGRLRSQDSVATSKPPSA